MPDQDSPPPQGSKPRSGRRLLVLRATGLVGAAALTGCIQVPAGNNAYRTGLNDSDPSDGPGQGRGNRGYSPQHRNTGVSDSDPSDGPGQGRGTALLRAAIEGARRRGYARLRLAATEDGRRLYAAHGFRARDDAMELPL